ncbi:MAG: electron transfer flavoprotein subunit alpha/FixB family protein [Enterocloster asparagiformis]|nr:electron transfer flavoprotein subunit alpha/FixB family protein [Enterocloster asparagiformis]
MESKTKDLWVFVETDENGSARNVGLELLVPGRMIAGKQGGRLVGVVIGDNVGPAVEAVSRRGADQILVVEGPEYRHYSTDAYAAALCRLVETYGPTSMLIGATNNGRDLGPRVACRLKTGLTADCTALDVDEESGNVAWTRPAFGGNLMATILCPDHRPQIGTVRPGVFKQGEPGESRAEVIREEIHVPAEDIRTQVLELIKDMDSENVDLEGASIIVSGGRGVGGPDGFKPIRELAEALGGTVGASRAAVDSGWISHAHQVGQTGKTVGPKLYIACGISGAIQHLAGMSGSDKIVAVNKDPEAPIFGVADYGVVGDLFEVLPVLTEAFKSAGAGRR